MVSQALHIQSDFSDYYDCISSQNGIIYKRNMSDCKQRGSALKYLRGLGIKTLEVKQVNSFSYLDDKLVVYTDPKKHNGKGKKICTYSEAILNYGNFLASKYIENTNDLTVKYLQIGRRRFTLTFKKYNEDLLSLGKLVDISESTEEYNRLIGLPIFSIDYISNGVEMIATDFNEVQNLGILGINNYLSTDDIVEEIIGALIAYNKVERK